MSYSSCSLPCLNIASRAQRALEYVRCTVSLIGASRRASRIVRSFQKGVESVSCFGGRSSLRIAGVSGCVASMTQFATLL